MHIDRKTVNLVLMEDMKKKIDKFGRNNRNSPFFKAIKLYKVIDKVVEAKSKLSKANSYDL